MHEFLTCPWCCGENFRQRRQAIYDECHSIRVCRDGYLEEGELLDQDFDSENSSVQLNVQVATIDSLIVKAILCQRATN